MRHPTQVETTAGEPTDPITSITLFTEPGPALIRVHARFDFDAALARLAILRRAGLSRDARVAIDLTDCDALSGPGIAALMLLHERHARRGEKPRLYALHQDVLASLRRARLDRYFDIRAEPPGQHGVLHTARADPIR